MIFLAKRPVDRNAIKALEGMKLEIANEINYHSRTTGDASKGTARNIAEIGERELSQDGENTFNPS